MRFVDSSLQPGFDFTFTPTGTAAKLGRFWKFTVFNQFIKPFIGQLGELRNECHIDELVFEKGNLNSHDFILRYLNGNRRRSYSCRFPLRHRYRWCRKKSINLVYIFWVFPVLQVVGPHCIPRSDNYISGLLLSDNWLYASDCLGLHDCDIQQLC